MLKLVVNAPIARCVAVATTLAFAATIAACSGRQESATIPNAIAASDAHAAAVGKLEISKSGSGLMVRMINPKNGTATSFRSYQTDKANCHDHEHPCYIFSAVNGTAPLPVDAPDCSVDDISSQPTAYCPARGISSVTIDAPTGGTIGYDASDSAELGKNCFPSSLFYEVGAKDVYSVLAWDGCKETIRCAGKNFGTVDADFKDVIEGPCYFVKRH